MKQIGRRELVWLLTALLSFGGAEAAVITLDDPDYAAHLAAIQTRNQFVGLDAVRQAMTETSPFASADFSLSASQWGGASGQGAPASLTYSFMATGVTIDETHPSIGGPLTTSTYLNDFMPAGWKTEIERALQAWSDVAGLNFVEIADASEAFDTNFGPQLSGDIRFAGHAFDGPNGTLAHAFFPSPGWNGAGDTHFDIADTWKIGFGGGGFDIFQVAAHEIGHAIGLQHTAVPNSLMNPTYTEAFSGPQADDIAGAQANYGAAAPEPAWLGALAVVALSLYSSGRRTRMKIVSSQ